MEGKRRRRTAPFGGKMGETSSSQTVCTKLERIAKLAKQVPAPLTTLAHHIDIEWLREAHRRTRKDGARGVDGQSAEQYERDLEGNLASLLDRAKAGTYRAPPVRRVYIPKGDGQQRPLGIPTYEDKVLQRAVAMLLEAVYEQEFLDCSYGFRPGRSAHQALGALRDTAMEMKGAWVLEVDMQKYFDTIDHEQLRNVLHRPDRRWRDPASHRQVAQRGRDGGRGATANRLRHASRGRHLADAGEHLPARRARHVVRTRRQAAATRTSESRALRRRLRVAFEQEEDAHRVKEVLPKRFGKFGLTLHPEKTRLVRFQPPSDDRKDDDRDGGGSGTFDLLGFTLYWAPSKRGYWVVQVKTAKSRFSRTLERLSDWCRRNRHLPVAVQWKQLTAKLRGHYAYFGIIGNAKALFAVNHATYRIWRLWLNHRSQRARVTWAKMRRLVQRYPLPQLPVLRSLRA